MNAFNIAKNSLESERREQASMDREKEEFKWREMWAELHRETDELNRRESHEDRRRADQAAFSFPGRDWW